MNSTFTIIWLSLNPSVLCTFSVYLSDCILLGCLLLVDTLERNDSASFYSSYSTMNI